MAARAATPALGEELKRTVAKAATLLRDARLRELRARATPTAGSRRSRRNRSARTPSRGSRRIDGIVKPGIAPPKKGLYLLDVVPDGEVRFGFPNINDNAEIAELIACGSQVILFSTGRGSVVGSAIAPVIKVCANPGHVQADGGRHGRRRRPHPRRPRDAARGRPRDLRPGRSASATASATKSEALGHQEFILTYKSFEPLGPACLPV